MNKIKIFFAGSVDEFSAKMMELSDFVRRLNDCYLDRGIYFVLVTNADAESDVSDGSDLIAAGYDLAFFLFGDKLEKKVYEAFETVFASFKKTGKPKVITYFKTDGTQPPTEEIEQLKGRLGNEPDYYYNTYSHIDTLKLGMLMSIKRLDLNGVDIRLNNGKAWQGNDVLLPLNHVEMVSGYEELERLKTERAKLEDGFYQAKTRYTENPEDTAAYSAYIEALGRRNEAIKEIRDIETRLYNMIEGMYEQTAQGRISKRQAESYKLIERGLLDEARKVLDYDAIISESRHDDEIAEQAAQRAQVHVNELMQLKSLNETLFDWEGVENCFSEAVRLEEKHGLPRKATLKYVSFLTRQRRHKEGLDIGERLRMYYQETGSESEEYDAAILYNELGLMYSGLHRIDEAEGALKKSLELRQKQDNAETYSPKLSTAGVYNNLGSLYYLVERYEQSAEAYETGLKIQKALTEDHCAGELAYKVTIVQGNLAIAYYEMQKYGESVEVLESAMDLTKKLIASEPENIEYRFGLSFCHTTLGDAYCRMQRYIEAEEQYISAHEILAGLIIYNPDKYEMRLASNDSAFGNMYLEAKRYPEAEAMLVSSLDLYKTLTGRNITIPIAQLTDCYKDLGCLYKETKRFAEAEAALRSALRLYDDNINSNPIFMEKADEIHALLDTISKAQLQPEEASSSFTPEEQTIALLLTEGLTQREISRKLGITALEFSRRVSAIREKVTGMAPRDPIIDEVAKDRKLTRREVDILRYLHKNNGNDVIAAELFLSEETVRIHVRNVLRKLGLDSRQHVSAWLDNYSARE